MPPTPPLSREADPAAPLLAARLIETLGGLDLTSADGRAGIRALLSEIERLAPGAILRQAASIELRRVGWGKGRERQASPAGFVQASPEGRKNTSWSDSDSGRI